jgi:hypothetical protein
MSAVNTNIEYTRRTGWLSGNVLDSCSGDIHAFPQTLQANARIVPRLGHDHFQIITHLTIHSVLYS